jgi:hypothetical protein
VVNIKNSAGKPVPGPVLYEKALMFNQQMERVLLI